jgi:heme-degrading monooxygenase HmoA
MITFINVFSVEPDQQQAALQNIKQVYVEVVQHQPGFIDAKLLESTDKKRVTAVARWESEAHLQAIRTHPRFQELHNDEFYQAIISNESHTYHVVAEL